MKLIAHRGLTNGPDGSLENVPEQILNSLYAGYDCEIDVRYIDGKWMLGHDNPMIEVPFEFLEQSGLWIHAKNLDALYQLTKTSLTYFWHQHDDYTLTSNGYIWTYPGMPLSSNSISVMPEWDKSISLSEYNPQCYGICSDYVIQFK